MLKRHLQAVLHRSDSSQWNLLTNASGATGGKNNDEEAKLGNLILALRGSLFYYYIRLQLVIYPWTGATLQVPAEGRHLRVSSAL